MFERTVAEKMRTVFPNAKRHLEFQSQEAKGVDLDHTGPFQVQCKALHASPNVPKVFSEFTDLSQEQIPVIAFKVDGKGTYMAFRFDDALRLMKAFQFTQD